jgi:hypothetical protein
LPALRKRISFSFQSTAFSERMLFLELNRLRTNRRRDARKRTMSALGVRGLLAREKYRRFKGLMEPVPLSSCSLNLRNLQLELQV